MEFRVAVVKQLGEGPPALAHGRALMESLLAAAKKHQAKLELVVDGEVSPGRDLALQIVGAVGASMEVVHAPGERDDA